MELRRLSTRTTSDKPQLAVRLQSPRLMWRKLLVLAGTVCIAAACHTSIRSTATAPVSPDQTAELWRAPEPNRDLFWGVGGQALAPDPSAAYKLIELKKTGFSMGMTVEGSDGRKWSANRSLAAQ